MKDLEDFFSFLKKCKLLYLYIGTRTLLLAIDYIKYENLLIFLETFKSKGHRNEGPGGLKDMKSQIFNIFILHL